MRRTSPRSTSTTCRSTWCRSTTAGAPASGEGSVSRTVRLPARPGRRRIRAPAGGVGIWVAPFLVGARTALAREHPEWLVGDAGRNWGQDLVGLDLTHPGVRDLLTGSLQPAARRWGSTTSSSTSSTPAPCPGRREDLTRSRLPLGARLVREVVGPDAYLVGCGAPLLPSVGLVDAMRVSPDTFHEGGEDGLDRLRGLMPLAARAWQQGRFWVNDPDCLVARPSYAQRERVGRRRRAFGGLRSFSDRVAELDDWGLSQVRGLLADGGTAGAVRRPRFRAEPRPRRARRDARARVSAVGARPHASRRSRAALPRRARRGHRGSSRWPSTTPPGWPAAGSSRPTHATACLITYGDGIRRAGETPLHTLAGFLHDHVGDVISDVHLLPIFPWTSDDGFAVVDHRAVNPALGTWDDVAELAGRPRADVRLRRQPHLEQ